MKSSRRMVGVVVLAAAGAGGAWWWFARPEAAGSLTAANNVHAPKSNAAAVPAPGGGVAPRPPAPQAVELPVAPPATVSNVSPLSANSSSAASPAESAANSDPQADLKTALPDMARLLRAGDLAEFSEIYTPPDKLTPAKLQSQREAIQQIAQQAAANPQYRQFLSKINAQMAQAYEALADQTPTFNAAGDEATYMMSPQGVDPYPQTFVKINGKWYQKTENP